MPIYEYKCDRCDNVFEVIQKFVDPPVAVHEQCGGKVVRLISTSALQFKGSGFYITDYKKTGGKDAKVANAKNGDSTSSSDSSKSESASGKPAETPAATAKPTPAPASTSSTTESKK